jgi:outer membrane protein assembly factor BamA
MEARLMLRVIVLLMALYLSGAAFAAPDVHIADTVKISTRNKNTVPDTGRYVQVRKIIILGNKLTRNGIILRELTLKKGDVVSESYLSFILEKDKRKIFNLHLFNTVDIRVLDLTNNIIDLLIEVDERWYTFPIPIFQLSDRNFNEWWENYNHDFNRVNYGVKLYQYNVRGRNETLIITTQFGFQKRFELMYRIPYIDQKQKQGLAFEIDYVEAKSVADSTVIHKLDFFKSRKLMRSTRGIGLTYTYRNNFYIQHRVKYEFRQTNISDTLRKLNPNYLGNGQRQQQFDALTYEFISDHRDVIAYPLKGYQFYVHLQQNGMAFHKDLNKTEGFISFSGFADLKQHFYLANLTYLYASTPENIPYFNYGVMGYNKIFIRGYEVYVIEGPQYFLNKTTLKKRIFHRNWQIENNLIPQFNYFPISIYLKTYADFGYVNNYPAYQEKSVNTYLSNQLLAGAGTGIDIVTAYDFVMRFEYTYTSKNQKGFFFHIKKEF